MNYPFSREVEQQIIVAYTSDSTATLESISSQFKIPAGWIARVLRTNKIHPRIRILVPKKEQQEIIYEYQKGNTTIKKLSNKYGWASSCISRFLTKTLDEDEIRFNQKNQPESFGESLVMEYLDNQVTHATLAKKYNITRSTLTHRIAAATVSNPKYADKTKAFEKRARAKRSTLPVSPEHLYFEIKSTKITQLELAERYHVSESCIYHALARFKKQTGLDPYADGKFNRKRKQRF